MSADRASVASMLSAIEEVLCTRHRSLSMPVALANLRRPARSSSSSSFGPHSKTNSRAVPLGNARKLSASHSQTGNGNTSLGERTIIFFNPSRFQPTSLKTRILPWSLSASAFPAASLAFPQTASPWRSKAKCARRLRSCRPFRGRRRAAACRGRTRA